MKIREVTKEDLGALATLYVSVFEADPWNEKWEIEWAFERLSYIFQSPGFHGYQAETEQGAVAAILGRSNSFKGNKEFEIVELFVDRQFQSKGIGKKLWGELEANLIEENYKYSILLTARNIDAYKFYLARGFKESESIVFMFRNLQDR